ncbi:MAG: hypothetical protein R3C04_07340 [Hyphomonas sp.]
MLRTPVTAEDFHGDSGIAGLGPARPSRTARWNPHTPSATSSRHWRGKAAGIHPGGHRPDDQYRAALVLDPSIAASIGRFVLMAGADSEGGNITPTAEFTCLCRSACRGHRVQFRRIPATVMSLDVTHTVRAELPRIDRLKALKLRRLDHGAPAGSWKRT